MDSRKKPLVPQPHSDDIESEIDDFDLLDESESEAPANQVNDDIQGTGFRERKLRLRPAEVYYAGCGIFHSDRFQCVDVIHHDNFNHELARVYRRDDDGMLYVMYYPGKDNDRPQTPADPTCSLDIIMSTANQTISAIYGQHALDHAKRIFIVAESNTYWWWPIAHYIKGDLTRRVLTTTDSINRNYDESYLTESENLPHDKREVIKTGYQSMLLDNWSCGYHSLEAIERDLRGESDPTNLEITDSLVQKHFQHYLLGKNYQHSAEASLASDDQLLDSDVLSNHEDGASVAIPVGGQIGSFVEDCSISSKQLEIALRKYTKDKNLEVIAKNSNGLVTLKIDTVKSVPLLDNLGLTKVNNQYQLIVNKAAAKVNPVYTDHLFGIRIQINDQPKSIDVSHLFAADDIRHYRDLADRNRSSAAPQSAPVSPLADPAPTSNPDSVLANMQGINRYLKNRAQETSGFFYMLTNSYTGDDYYARRDSWKTILKKMHEHIQHPNAVSVDDLKYFIMQEAIKFKSGFFSIFSRSKYHDHLMALHDAITSNSNLNNLSKSIFTYYQMYTTMNAYKNAAKSYCNNYSLFYTPKNESMAKLGLSTERELYDAHYQMLSESDKKDFLETSDEHMAEYDNIRRLS